MRKTHTELIAFRCTPRQAQMLDEIAAQLRTGRSGAIKTLIESAEVKPARVTVNANSRSASAYQGKSATAVSQ